MSMSISLDRGVINPLVEAPPRKSRPTEGLWTTLERKGLLLLLFCDEQSMGIDEDETCIG